MSLGQNAGWGFLLAGIVAGMLACSSNDSAPKTAAGGAGGQTAISSADAGRALPGEGYEATPDFDIHDPQRPLPDRDQLVEGVTSTLNGVGGNLGTSPRARDAGTDADAAL